MAEGTQLPPQLVKYWVAGPGAKAIAWNTPGDWARCKVEINAAIVKGGSAPLSDRVLSGLCSSLHLLATGGRPGHGSAEQGAGKG